MTKEAIAARIDKLYRCLGNGDEDAASRILTAICVRLEHARKKHPVFSEGSYHALGVIEAEFHELEYAVEHESEDRQMDEALDVIATCIRFLCLEYERKNDKDE